MPTPSVTPAIAATRAQNIIKQQTGLSVTRVILLGFTIGAFLNSQAILTSYLSLIDSTCYTSACIWFQRQEFVVIILLILIMGCVNDSMM